MKAEYLANQGFTLKFGHSINELALALDAVLEIKRRCNTPLFDEMVVVLETLCVQRICRKCGEHIGEMEEYTLDQGAQHVHCPIKVH